MATYGQPNNPFPEESLFEQIIDYHSKRKAPYTLYNSSAIGIFGVISVGWYQADGSPGRIPSATDSPNGFPEDTFIKFINCGPGLSEVGVPQGAFPSDIFTGVISGFRVWDGGALPPGYTFEVSAEVRFLGIRTDFVRCGISFAVYDRSGSGQILRTGPAVEGGLAPPRNILGQPIIDPKYMPVVGQSSSVSRANFTAGGQAYFPSGNVEYGFIVTDWSYADSGMACFFYSSSTVTVTLVPI